MTSFRLASSLIFFFALAGCSSSTSAPATDSAHDAGGDALQSDDAAAGDAADGSEQWSPICSRTLADECRSRACPTDWSSARAFAIAQCQFEATLPQSNILLTKCGGYDTLMQGDPFVGLIYYFAPTDGKLVAIFTYADTHPSNACIAGPASFQEGACDATPIERTTCAELRAPKDAGGD